MLEVKDYLNLEGKRRDIVVGYLTSYITCLEGILEDREEQLKDIKYNIKKLREEKTAKRSDIEFLEGEMSSIEAIIEFTKREITYVKDSIRELETLTYCVIRPATISQAKREIAQITGVPENIIEVEINHVTPIYTQYSLMNRFEVYEKAKNKERVTDYYRFPSMSWEK